ncbi:MAG: hypothetical protein R3F11_21505 [Verrucomicrobiales bacterium]
MATAPSAGDAGLGAYLIGESVAAVSRVLGGLSLRDAVPVAEIRRALLWLARPPPPPDYSTR